MSHIYTVENKQFFIGSFRCSLKSKQISAIFQHSDLFPTPHSSSTMQGLSCDHYPALKYVNEQKKTVIIKTFT